MNSWLSCSGRSRIRYVSNDVVKGEKDQNWDGVGSRCRPICYVSEVITPWCPFFQPINRRLIKIQIEFLELME
jgi:hypothetical protein